MKLNKVSHKVLLGLIPSSPVDGKGLSLPLGLGEKRIGFWCSFRFWEKDALAGSRLELRKARAVNNA